MGRGSPVSIQRDVPVCRVARWAEDFVDWLRSLWGLGVWLARGGWPDSVDQAKILRYLPSTKAPTSVLECTCSLLAPMSVGRDSPVQRKWRPTMLFLAP